MAEHGPLKKGEALHRSLFKNGNARGSFPADEALNVSLAVIHRDDHRTCEKPVLAHLHVGGYRSTVITAQHRGARTRPHRLFDKDARQVIRKGWARPLARTQHSGGLRL